MIIGQAIAGVGFGASFTAALRLIFPLAAAHQRAGVVAVIYVISYVPFGVPIVIAGLLAGPVGLVPTVFWYSAVTVLLALISLGAQVRLRRRGPVAALAVLPSARFSAGSRRSSGAPTRLRRRRGEWSARSPPRPRRAPRRRWRHRSPPSPSGHRAVVQPAYERANRVAGDSRPAFRGKQRVGHARGVAAHGRLHPAQRAPVAPFPDDPVQPELGIVGRTARLPRAKRVRRSPRSCTPSHSRRCGSSSRPTNSSASLS